MRIGIVGTCFINEQFMDAAKQVEDVEIVAVSSRSAEKAKEYAVAHNIEHAFGSYQEMAESGVIDAAYVPIPNSLHKEVSIYFLEHKIPVLCEKPFALNSKEVKEMFDCADKNQTLIMDAIVPLYTPNFFAAKECLAKVGPVHRADFIYSQRTGRWDKYLAGEHVDVLDPKLGNGTIMALGVYPVADVVALLGKPKEIIAKAMFTKEGCDYISTAILQYEDYQVVISNNRCVESTNHCEIATEHGNLCFSNPQRMPEVWYVDRKTHEKTDLSCTDKMEMAYEIQEFYNCWKEGKMESSIVPRQLTMDIIEVLTGIREAMGLKFPTEE